ncbi:MAG TPA: hypothetical protein PLD25_20000 [Chloroflexota bacterium]|nr:hypothetical protein [Chloroflexota bacterium]HUM71114.1 hypothetical protein [Chloroflexota bacterium]
MTTIIASEEKPVEQPLVQTHIATGSAAATFIASGIGALFLGLMTTGAEFSVGLKDALNWWNPVGPLAGKTGIAVLTWLISWVLLNTLWKNKEIDLRKSFIITLVLIGLGVLFTFPPIFEAFAAE